MGWVETDRDGLIDLTHRSSDGTLMGLGTSRFSSFENDRSPFLISNPNMVRSVSKQALEPSRCQVGVAHRMLDRLVAEIGLDRSGIDAVV